MYYYDFLSKETRGGIPEGALQHIKQCQSCQTEMDSLKDLFVKAGERFESEQSRKDSAISTLLRLHFEYIGEPVKCDIVKPFLASLADPVLQIRIPTPITTHLDKCQSCRDDLLILLDLHLPHKYLCRLGQILAYKPVEDEFSCSQAQAAIPAVVSMAFHETNAEILKHLCTCPNCRKQLYLRRESIRKELLLNKALQNGFPCESVSATDIYDYCLPYGIDPADDQYIEFRESLTSHLRRCPKCLSKMQQLHRTISNLAERAESEVITIYNIDESAKTKSCCESEPYAGFTISSEMAGTEDNLHIEQPKTINLTARLKRKAPALNLKPLLKAGLVAAVIVIGLALLFNTPAAKAVTIEQICRALENAKNVYIATFKPGKTEPEQERWVSRSLNTYMTKTGEELVLLELANKVRRVKHFNTGSVETSPLPTETITGMENMITGSLGLVPFSDLSLVPEDAEWNHVTSNELKAASDTAIYELIWIERSPAGNKVFNKWRVLVDPKTYLPRKTESYTKSSGDSEYTLRSVKIVEYLSDIEMETLIQEVSF
ncbi:MAG TPA: hypothetical protein VMX36_01910 [Sedimentisphaerales bacterium]|nr:hypothetical protein [Sedimentisphaerales bacterium]